MVKMMKRGVKNKKGVSEVIGTVLIILIVIAAIAIITPIIINFVRQGLTKGTSCFAMVGKISVDSQGYACSNETATYVTVALGDADISEIKVAIYKAGSSEPFILKKGNATNVKMLNNSTNLELPPKGGSRTYVFTCNECKNAERASIIPRVKGEDCNEAIENAELSSTC